MIPSFFVDVMLGTLAKWLRLLGFNAVYDNQITDDDLVERCVEQNRIALTRDRRLVQRRALRGRALLIESDSLPEQIQQVLKRFPVPKHQLPFTRCTHCNSLLVPLDRPLAQSQVPPYVYQTQEKFKQCPNCGRILWKGTHRARILAKLKELGSR